jgi:WD40-like Beta Propeller Repeat
MRCLVAGLFVIGLVLPPLSQAPAGDAESIKPINLDKVNTEADEDDPFLAADDLSLYYASNTSGTFDILVAQRRTAGAAWLPGKRLRLNSKNSDARSPLVRRGTLYFASNKVPDESLKDLKNFDLYQKTGLRAPLPILGVSEKEDELFPWITPSGNTFYFSRKTEEGWRLFAANGPVPGPIGKATVMDLPIGFHHATVRGDLLVMYLQGPLEKERWGLFRTTRLRVGTAWGKPEPLTGLNSPEAPRGDMSPCLSADGTKLYFASDRPGGKGGLDLWMVPTAQLK